VFAGFGAVLARSETRTVDSQLQSALRASSAAYAEEVAYTRELAAAFAADPRVRDALARAELPELEALLASSARVRVDVNGQFTAGQIYPVAVERSASIVTTDGRLLGRVIASLPLDQALSDHLRSIAGLRPGQRLALVEDGRIVTASPGLGGRLELPLDRPAVVGVGGTRFRALAAKTSTSDTGVRIVVLSPQAWIDSATRSGWLRLLAALAVSLALIAGVAYLLGHSIVATLRQLVAAARGLSAGMLSERVVVRGRDEFAQLGAAFNEMAEQLQERVQDLEAERRRLRDVTIRFGEALASTHDVDQLLLAIVETAVESTRAVGGRVTGPEGRIVEVGDPEAGPDRIELPLQAGGTSFGSLVLYGSEFSVLDVESASLLVGHGVIALENARLHRILERQALVDALTGLANRRAAEQELAIEVSRAVRFGSPLSIVFADLDHFKRVNDTFGHPTGDLVLRELASVLAATVRDIDHATRWGGEEFCLILPGTDVAGAARLAERVRAALQQRTILTTEGMPLHVTASFGVAGLPPLASVEELIASADAALYDAKRRGRNCVSIGTSPVSAA
jgi:diguanylate cyclase (GGDEF)-like protein